MELRVLTSPGDGVGPAVLLDLDAHTQYMFRAPEGISRLALEHGQRPGLGLRAVFAWDSAASQVGVGRGVGWGPVLLGDLALAASHVLGQGRRGHPNPLLDTFGTRHAQEGLSGLIMRLRSDGNEQVHVTGPQGATLGSCCRPALVGSELGCMGVVDAVSMA